MQEHQVGIQGIWMRLHAMFLCVFFWMALWKSGNISYYNYSARLTLWDWFPHAIVFLKAEMTQKEIILHIRSHFIS